MSKLEAPTSLVINSMENIELPGEVFAMLILLSTIMENLKEQHTEH